MAAHLPSRLSNSRSTCQALCLKKFIGEGVFNTSVEKHVEKSFASLEIPDQYSA